MFGSVLDEAAWDFLVNKLKVSFNDQEDRNVKMIAIWYRSSGGGAANTPTIASFNVSFHLFPFSTLISTCTTVCYFFGMHVISSSSVLLSS